MHSTTSWPPKFMVFERGHSLFCFIFGKTFCLTFHSHKHAYMQMHVIYTFIVYIVNLLYAARIWTTEHDSYGFVHHTFAKMKNNWKIMLRPNQKVTFTKEIKTMVVEIKLGDKQNIPSIQNKWKEGALKPLGIKGSQEALCRHFVTIRARLLNNVFNPSATFLLLAKPSTLTKHQEWCIRLD